MRGLSTATILVLVLIAVAIATVGVPVRAQETTAIIIGTTDLPTSLDVGEANTFSAWEVLSHLYTGLMRQVPGSFTYAPALAETMAVSDDRLTYTFTLRPGIAFTDGTPITAQTFVNSIARVLALGRGAAEVVAPYVADVQASDDRTLIFTLRRPVPYFDMLVALPPYFPQHPSLAGSDTPQPFAAVIGNGPYGLESFAVRDQIVLRANPAYDLGAAPKTETIVLQHFARSQDLRDALRAQTVDLAWRALLLQHLMEIEDTTGLRVESVPGTRVFYLVFGQEREPTDDPLVREALTALIARQEAVERVFGGHIAALTSLVPPLFAEAYHPIWPENSAVDGAEATLRAAGYRERQTSRANFYVAFSRFVYGDPYVSGVAQLARSSFNRTDFVEYSVYTDVEASAFFDVLEEGTGSATIFAWNPIVPHPGAYLEPLLHSSHAMPANTGYATPEIDALLEQAAVLDDPAAQGALYAAAADLVLADHALVPLWQDELQVVAWDEITGIQIEPNYLLHYDQLERH